MGGAEWVGLGAGAALYEGHFIASDPALTAVRLLAHSSPPHRCQVERWPHLLLDHSCKRR